MATAVAELCKSRTRSGWPWQTDPCSQTLSPNNRKKKMTSKQIHHAAANIASSYTDIDINRFASISFIFLPVLNLL
jgi:hypothetical protein